MERLEPGAPAVRQGDDREAQREAQSGKEIVARPEQDRGPEHDVRDRGRLDRGLPLALRPQEGIRALRGGADGAEVHELPDARALGLADDRAGALGVRAFEAAVPLGGDGDRVEDRVDAVERASQRRRIGHVDRPDGDACRQLGRGPRRIAHERPDVRRVLEQEGDDRPADKAVRSGDRDAHPRHTTSG